MSTSVHTPVIEHTSFEPMAFRLQSISRSSTLVRNTVLMLVSTLVAIFAWAAFTDFDEDVIATGAVVANLYAPDETSDLPDHLSALIAAPIREVEFREGEVFGKNQVVVCLDVEKQKNRLAKVSQEIGDLQQHLLGLNYILEQDAIAHEKALLVFDGELNESQGNITRNEHRRESEIRAANVELMMVKSNLERTKRLLRIDASSQYELEKDTVKYHEAVKRLELAKVPVGREELETIQRRRAASIEEFKLSQQRLKQEIQSLQAKVKAMRFDATELEHTIARSKIEAPYDGVVVKSNVTAGQWQPQGKIDIQIAPVDRPLIVKIRVNSKQLGKVVPRQDVKFFAKTFDRLKDGPIVGEVIAVPQSSVEGQEKDGDAQQYEVVAQLEKLEKEDRDRIKIGTAGQCIIKTGRMQSHLNWFREEFLQRFYEAK